MLRLTWLPLIVIVPPDFTSSAPEVVSLTAPPALTLMSPPFAVIFTDLPWMSTWALALMVMASADSMLVTLSAVLIETLFFLVESTTVTFSAPSVSSKMMRCPLFDLTTLTSFLPSLFDSGGFCLSFHSEPITTGRSISPWTKTTRT